VTPGRHPTHAATESRRFANLPSPEILSGTVTFDWRNSGKRCVVEDRIRRLGEWGTLDARHQTLLSGAVGVLIGHLVFATHVFPVSTLRHEDGVEAPLEPELEEFAGLLSAVRGYAEVFEVEKHVEAYKSIGARPFDGYARPRVPFALSFPGAERHPLTEDAAGSSLGRHGRGAPPNDSGVFGLPTGKYLLGYLSPKVRFIRGPIGRASKRLEPGEAGFDQILLFSGGIDSALLAARSDEKTLLLHVESNISSRVSESGAARRVAAAAGASGRLLTCKLLFPDLAPLARRFSRIYGRHPYFNTVPHGRDLVLVTVAAALARNLRAREILLGYEKDSARKELTAMGAVYPDLWPGVGSVPRHDFEHEDWHVRLLGYLSHGMPIEDRLTQSPLLYQNGHMMQVRETLVDEHADMYPKTSSCFWGTRCERCIKCVAEYALLRRFQFAHDGSPGAVALSEKAQELVGLLGFASDPLDDPSAQEIVDLMANQGAAYQAILLPALEDLMKASSSGRSTYRPYWVLHFTRFRPDGGV
jgi:7-cyano-7-deazaguanine synthase in queuosine biosynthesis